MTQRMHNPTRFENEITDKGAARQCAYQRLSGWKGNEKKPTQEQLARVEPDLLAKMKEVVDRSQEEKDGEKKELENALKALEKRIHPAPGPPLPDSLWESMCSRDNHKEEFPKLNDATKKALIKKSEPYDMHPECWMLELGEYLFANFTSNEMVGYIRDLGNYRDENKTSLSKLFPPKVVAQLAYDVILEASECTNWRSFEHTAELIMPLTQAEIKQAAIEDGLMAANDDEGTNKVELVVRLVEKIFADVLVAQAK